jgi:ribosome maturation factor RimP
VELEKIAAGVLSPLGYDVLEARLKPEGHRQVFLVRIERKDEVPVSVSDLEQANRALGSYLDQHDPFAGEDQYLLQVESPGAERPLFTARHFERFMGLKVKVRSEGGNFTGRVQMVRPDEVDFLLDSKETRTLKLGTFKANLAEWPDRPR